MARPSRPFAPGVAMRTSHSPQLHCDGNGSMAGLRAPSRPREFHPEPLTESVREPLDSHGSCHPVKAAAFRRNQSGSSCCQLTKRSQRAMTCPLRSTGITPLHRYYEAVRPCSGASVLSASRFFRLCLFPWHRRPGSQVPYESPDESHASCTPDTAWPVSRYPPCSSRSSGKAPVLMSSESLISMLHQRFACARLSHPYMT